MWRTAIVWFAIGGCIRDVGRGPVVGDCADLPDGVYTWGEIGIGTCLSGPADVQFVEQPVGTLLAVANADPFLNYTSGSLLFIDWDDVVARIEADAPDRLLMHDLDVVALPILDDDDGDGDGGNPFLGGMGVLPGGQTLLASSRLSEESVLRSSRDEVLVIDLTGVSNGRLPAITDELTLRDDPYAIAVHGGSDRAYVGNLTDHSISVLDIATVPPTVLDVADGGPLGPVTFTDVDRSGSFAEITELDVVFPLDVPNEHFSFTWIEGTTRIWLPSPTDADVIGLQRWTTGGIDLLPSAFGVELVHPGGLADPFAVNDTGQLSRMWYAAGGSIFQAIFDQLAIEDVWVLSTELPVLPAGSSCGDVLGGPSLTARDGLQTLFYDRRDLDGGDASVGIATTLDGLVWTCIGTPIVSEDGASLEDPFVIFDPRANRYRMWVSRRVAGQWTIALAESDDPVGWTEPLEIVLDLPDADVAAPAVQYLNGQYVLWAAVSETGSDLWTLSRATSADGRTWSELEPLIDSDAPFDPLDPPRAGLQFEPVGAWRAEGRDLGAVDNLLPSGLSEPTLVIGFTANLANGHEMSNGVVDRGRAALGLVPSSAVDVAGERWAYATVTGTDARERIAALAPTLTSWEMVGEPDALEAQLLPAGSEAGTEVLHPAVVADDTGLVMFYGVRDLAGITRIHRATSVDGLNWDSEADPVLADETATFDALTGVPHSIENLDNGAVRLWYAGDNADRFRIGSAVADDLRGDFIREPGPRDEVQFSTGLPGSFDDSGVKDPLIFEFEGATHMLYSGFDGVFWHIGHAVRDGDDEWIRRVDPFTGTSVPALSGLVRTFSAAGLESPVIWDTSEGSIEVLYGGTDGQASRLGTATATLSRLSDIDPQGRPRSTGVVYATQRVPTADDVLELDTERRGDGPESVIELAQLVQDFGVDGTGMTGMTYDPARGFLYVTTKANPIVYVVDVRDDSSGDFVDANTLDLEGIISIQNTSASSSVGYWSSTLSPSRSLLYLTQRNPDGLAVVDVSGLVDDDEKSVDFDTARAILPLPDLDQDEGAESLARIGGAGTALTPDEQLLLVTHFRGNSLHVFDLTLGPYGQEVAYMPFIGENPHIVRVSPDGRYAVVANYLGDVTGDALTSSTLVVVDIDPDSDTYLEAVTWLANL